MKRLDRIAGLGLSLLVYGVLAASCNPKDQTSQSSSLQPLTLIEELSITVDDPNVLIGDFSGLAVDERGIIYAADTRLQKIHLFSSNGGYLVSLGRKGEGPGEFMELDPDIIVLSDTLYVMDNNMRRINLFSLESRQSAGTVNIPGTE